jgi:hypothetical protein
MGKGCDVGDVVDGDDVELGAGLVGGPEQVPADAAKAVDSNLGQGLSAPLGSEVSYGQT